MEHDPSVLPLFVLSSPGGWMGGWVLQVGTFGVDYKLKEMTINDELVTVQVWDTAGQVSGVFTVTTSTAMATTK